MQDYKEKVNLIDELNEKLTLTKTENLAFKLELTTHKTKVEQLEKALTEAKVAVVSDTGSSSKLLSEATAQTEAIEIKEISTNTSFSENPSEPRPTAVNVPSNATTTETSSGVEELSFSSLSSPIKSAGDSPDASQIDTELKLMHHPDVEREEELIIFKEKYTKLVEEKLKLDQELLQLRDDYHQYRTKSFVHLLMYLAPILALFSYLLSFMMSSN